MVISEHSRLNLRLHFRGKSCRLNKEGGYDRSAGRELASDLAAYLDMLLSSRENDGTDFFIIALSSASWDRLE
jgi:hypothetical protein